VSAWERTTPIKQKPKKILIRCVFIVQAASLGILLFGRACGKPLNTEIRRTEGGGQWGNSGMRGET
jgi:hypothetical protein